MMMHITAYGTLERVGEKKKITYHEKGSKRQKKFQYLEVVFKHFNYRDSVDAHNSSRMEQISLEETWKATRWPVRVFTFLLAITEVNYGLAMENIYYHPACLQQEFKKLIPEGLIKDNHIHQEKFTGCIQRWKQFMNEHYLVPLPKKQPLI